jgi:hypothetical protein
MNKIREIYDGPCVNNKPLLPFKINFRFPLPLAEKYWYLGTKFIAFGYSLLQMDEFYF